MAYERFLLRYFACVTFGVLLLEGEPSVCWVINDADVPPQVAPGVTVPSCYSVRAPYTPPLARGSIASVIGENLGPATGMAGVMVRVTVQGTTAEATILAVEPGRIRAIVPTQLQPGVGSLAVSYNGVSRAYEVRIVDRDFRLYHRAPQAVAQNVSQAGELHLNGFSSPVRPGQLLVLWGTGLGPTKQADQNLVGFIGLRPARVVYAGPSGC